MREYRAKTAPILPFYEAKGLLRRINGMSSVDEVAAQIDAILDNLARESLSLGLPARGVIQVLIAILVVLSAAQAAGAAAPSPAVVVTNGAAVPTQATPVVKPKKKRRTCSTGEAGLGSHIAMEDCPSDADEYEQLRAAHQAQQALQDSGPKVGGPH